MNPIPFCCGSIPIFTIYVSFFDIVGGMGVGGGGVGGGGGYKPA